MKNLFLILIAACFSLQASAQSNADSLYTIWEDKTQSDSKRAYAYKNYIWNEFLFSQPDSAFALAEILVAFSQEKHNSDLEAVGYNLQAISVQIKGDYSKALDYYELSLKIREEIEDTIGISTSLSNIGIAHYSQGNYRQALNYFKRGLELEEILRNDEGITSSLNAIGLVYSELGHYVLALNYYSRSLRIAEEIGNQKAISDVLNNIGEVYGNQGNYPLAIEYCERSLKIVEELGVQYDISNLLASLGKTYSYQNDDVKALDYLNRSLKISQEIEDKSGIANSLGGIGEIYFKQDNYSQALDYFTSSLKISEEIGEKGRSALSLVNIGTVYNKQRKHANALIHCKKALSISEEIEVLKIQSNACRCLYDAYKATDKGNEALVYLEKIQVLNDSLDAEETTKKLQQMEFAKQVLADSIVQAEEARLIEEAHQEEVRQKNKTRNIFGGVGFFALLLAGGFYWRWRYVRESKAVLQVEKDRSENLLLNILPEEIAEELKEKGKADARDFDMVSILFTDFKGFTAASEKLSAQDLVSEINTCFEAFDGIMGKYNIEKIKTIGDAYMAAGGLPVPTDDSVRNTVLAALEMQDFIRDRKAKLDAEGKPGFEMRVGVHTGPVVAGIVGVKKFQYDIWGDTVNTASRMESSGEVGKVNISEATYELLKDYTHFSFKSRGKIEAKGKGEIEMYFVEAV